MFVGAMPDDKPLKRLRSSTYPKLFKYLLNVEIATFRCDCILEYRAWLLLLPHSLLTPPPMAAHMNAGI